MEIIQANTDWLTRLYAFSARAYPGRRVEAKRYVDFWFSKTADNCQNTLLLCKGEQLVGQMFGSAMSYYYQDKVIESCWAFDLFVEKSLRKDTWGLDLMLQWLEEHPNACETGSGPDALPINLKMGFSWLGEIRKYVGFTNPLWLPLNVGRRNVETATFLPEICVQGHRFRRCTEEALPRFNKPFAGGLFEPTRDVCFLRWRYFNKLHPYAIYYEDETGWFFALRTIRQKHVRALVLLDYRCPIDESAPFDVIFRATQKVAAALHTAILICGSSLDRVDRVLEKHHMRSIGRPRPVLGMLDVSTRREDIEKREFAFVTLADSDGETSWE